MKKVFKAEIASVLGKDECIFEHIGETVGSFLMKKMVDRHFFFARLIFPSQNLISKYKMHSAFV